jgi:hypothetical protein
VDEAFNSVPLANAARLGDDRRMKKPLLLPLVRLCGAVIFSATFAACSGVAGSSAEAPKPMPAAAPVKAAPAGGLLQQIQAEIGDAACDSTAQCNTVAIGHKACGGPESYLAWSSKRSDGAKLASLAAAHTAERKVHNVKSGMMSTCSLVLDPGATCNAGKCVAGKDGMGAPLAR